MSTLYYTHNTSAIYPAYITWNQQSSSSHVTIPLTHHFSTITGPKALSTSLSAMSPDSSQPIAIIICYRPHGLINRLYNEQPLIPDHGSRLTPPKLPREPTGCASLGAAGGTQRPSSRPRLCHVLLSYCVLCFAIFVIRYPRTRIRCIHDIHVFFFMCSKFTAHSPTNLCEKGWGYHCSVLVWLLALLLN